MLIRSSHWIYFCVEFTERRLASRQETVLGMEGNSDYSGWIFLYCFAFLFSMVLGVSYVSYLLFESIPVLPILGIRIWKTMVLSDYGNLCVDADCVNKAITFWVGATTDGQNSIIKEPTMSV